jgi:hypothetical protein
MKMPRYYITVHPKSRAEHPFAPAPTYVVDAANEDAARDKAEVRYRRSHADVERLSLRITPASARGQSPLISG